MSSSRIPNVRSTCCVQSKQCQQSEFQSVPVHGPAGKPGLKRQRRHSDQQCLRHDGHLCRVRHDRRDDQFAGSACHGHYQRRADRRAVGQHVEPQLGHPGCRKPGLPGKRHQPGYAPTGRLRAGPRAHHHHHHHHGGSGSETSGAGSSGTTTSNDATTQTGATTTTAATQPTSNQQTADLLALISSTSGGNQSINGFLLNVQT